MSARASRRAAAEEKRAKKRAAKEKLATLRAELRAARERRDHAAIAAKEQCRAERIAVGERLRALRLRVLQEYRDASRADRDAARAACAARRQEARQLRDAAAKARAFVVSERQLQADLRRAERDERARLANAPACVTCRHESDEEVLAAVPPNLAPLFRRIAQRISPSGKRSRTEMFLRYAEKHPEEVLEASKHATDARVRDLEAKERALVKAAGTAANSPSGYHARKAARIERLRARAERLAAQAKAAEEGARRIADVIPFGQPILVGHHSERRHRRDIERIKLGFSKGFELHKLAEATARRASAAATNRAISSDDPEAVAKLRAKLAKVEASRARMVEGNKAVRSKRPREALTALGYSNALIEEILTPDPMGRIGFPSYALANAAKEAARIKARIAELERRATRAPPPAIEMSGARIEEADNRVRIVFDAKPAEAVRRALKGVGFRWSPTANAWQRHASPAAWDAANRVLRAASAP